MTRRLAIEIRFNQDLKVKALEHSAVVKFTEHEKKLSDELQFKGLLSKASYIGSSRGNLAIVTTVLPSRMTQTERTYLKLENGAF